MVTYIESFLLAFSADEMTAVFGELIIGIFVLGVILGLLNKYGQFVAYVPTLLASIGILGTFLGISIGLANFDTTNIDNSISELLAGMRTAFCTSLFGMTFSILFKIIKSFAHTQKKEKKCVDDPMEILTSQATSIDSLVKAVGGDSDTSILSQIKLLRGDLNDNSRTTQRRQEEFANKLLPLLQNVTDMLAKSATEAIIEALRKVIADFNNNLTEQFGDNFKELNQAVQALVVWQEQYKEQIKQTTEQYQACLASLQSSEDSIKKIRDSTQSITSAMDTLNEIMRRGQRQLDELGAHLAAFKEMRDKAVEAVPTIREQVDKTVQAVSSAAEAATSHYNDLLRTTDSGLRAYVEKTGDAVEKQLEIIDKSMQDEVNRVMSAMGNALGQISNQFASDYTRLVNQMQRIVAAAGAIRQ